ncbi:MAG: peptidoglycan-binding protein [bacterium]|nr:peptidoglycan-binding protein [bacterium]
MVSHIYMRNFFAAVALIAGTALVPALASAQAITGDVNPNASATICVNLQNDLSRGQSDSQTNGEVSILQIFLQSTSTAGSNTPYLTGDPTGFFGIQTETAVKQFQTDQQLLSSGYVGPLTRAKIKNLTCTGGAVPANFSVTPASGAAPLQVTATFPQEWRSFIVQECANNLPRLGGRSFSIDWGDGTFPGQNGRIAPCATHTYTSAGTYTVSAKIYDFSDVPAFNGQFTQTVWTGSTTVTVTNVNSNAPVVNGIDGPASLNAGQTGTWTVNASVPNQPGAQVSYSVLWGDEVTPASGQASAPLQTSATFTHVYQNNGIYSPTFTVTNAAGSVSANLMVTVGGGGQCTNLQNDLSLNSTDATTNGEVSILQAFLQSTVSTAGFPYLSGTPTGYFGFLTQSAVRQFQSEHGLLAAGFVGPATRAQIKSLTCGGGTPSQDLSASVTSGKAPLTVKFTSGVGNKIDYGDGSIPDIFFYCQAIGCATQGFTTEHIYQSAGVYTARAFVGDTNIVGTVTIIVTGTVAPPPAAACTDLQNDFAYRSTDSQTNGEVSILQDFFQSAISPATGAPYLTGEPTGFFGQLTRAAVVQFQTDNGLPMVGTVGPITRAKIKEISCGSTPPSPPPPPIAECTDLQNNLSYRSTDSQTSGEVSLLQAFFQSVTSPTTGVQYLTGEPTGFFGQLTKAAVIQFQTDNGLTATGVAGPATRAKISALTCGETPPPPPPPPPPEVCNVDAEMQSCVNGAYAARIGPDCSWLACPYKPVVPTAPTISSFTAAATSLSYEGSTNLSWNVASSTGTTCSLSINGGTSASVPASNSAYNTGALTGTTKYTLSCSTDSGPVAAKDVTVKVASRELSCASQQQPQYVYGYGKLDADGKPFIRLQGNCSYFTGYSVFDTGWVQGAQLSKSGNCPVGLGLAVTGTASLDKSGLNVMSSYGGGYEGSCSAAWPSSFKWPDSSATDTRPGPTVDLAQSSASSQGEASISWKSTNADSCVIAYSTDGLTFTSWKFGTSGSGVSMSQISGFNNSGSWVFRATCTGNGAPAVDKVTHTIVSQPGGD